MAYATEGPISQGKRKKKKKKKPTRSESALYRTQETSDLAISEMVSGTRGGAAMGVGLGQRNAKGQFPGWSTCPNVH